MWTEEEIQEQEARLARKEGEAVRTNAYGQTYAAWLAAAGHPRSAAMQKAWEDGEDASEYRNSAPKRTSKPARRSAADRERETREKKEEKVRDAREAKEAGNSTKRIQLAQDAETARLAVASAERSIESYEKQIKAAEKTANDLRGDIKDARKTIAREKAKEKKAGAALRKLTR
jgi:hypothetical protein